MNTKPWVTQRIEQSISYLFQQGLVSDEKYAQLFSESNNLTIKTEPENSISFGCIIGVPQLKTNNTIERNVRIIIADDAEKNMRWKYKAYHEISHFLSISEVKQVCPEKWIQHWGFCSTSYSICGNKKIQVQHIAEKQSINENATDYLAAHLFSVFEDEKLDNHYFLRQGVLQKKRLADLCRLYLEEHKSPNTIT